MNFKAVLVLPKTAGSAQTHKSVSFIWIVWSTQYVYLWRIPQIASTDELTECWKIRQGTERRWDMTFTWYGLENSRTTTNLDLNYVFNYLLCSSTVDRNNRISMYVHCNYAKENWKRTVEFLCFTTGIAFMYANVED